LFQERKDQLLGVGLPCFQISGDRDVPVDEPDEMLRRGRETIRRTMHSEEKIFFVDRRIESLQVPVVKVEGVIEQAEAG
jgi:hypothetical protein